MGPPKDVGECLGRGRVLSSWESLGWILESLCYEKSAILNLV